MKETSVFAVLRKEPFEDFRSRGKKWEVCRAKRQWNRKQLRTGRGIILSCGYSGARIHGKIGRVIFGSLEEIFKEVPFRKIEPRAKSRREAIRENKKLLGKAKEYVAFEIVL